MDYLAPMTHSQMSSMNSLNPMSSVHHQHLSSHHHSASSGLSSSPLGSSLGSSPLSSSHHLVSLSSSSLNSGVSSLNNHAHSAALSHSSLTHTPLTHSGLNQGSPRSPSGAPTSLTPLPQDCLESYSDDKSSATAPPSAAWKNYQGFQSL
ncbi:hypothetical protein FHG87_018310 [Trinorchestia longiramus]|nr:hypothetical protein FHG87_018310 [Trinorchestia longiramus]